MKERDLKLYQENNARIKKIFQYKNDLRDKFSEKQIDEIERTYKLIKSQMDDLACDRSVSVSGKEKSLVRSAVLSIKSAVISKEINDILRDLVESLGNLILNWNRELGGRKEIDLDMRASQKIVRGTMGINEAIPIMKELLEKADNRTKYEPPAFELSRHYLRMLREENE